MRVGRVATQPPQAVQRANYRARLLAHLLSRHGDCLRNQAARHSGGVVEAEDVLQDAYVTFLRRFDAPPDAALPWLMVVIRHRAWQLAARRRRYQAPIAPSPTDALGPTEQLFAVIDDRPGPAERFERREQLILRIELFDRLKPDERTALLLCAAGFSYREIAAHQGWTQTKVNRCIYEGRAALRGLIAKGVKPSR